MQTWTSVSATVPVLITALTLLVVSSAHVDQVTNSIRMEGNVTVRNAVKISNHCLMIGNAVKF